MKVIKRDGRIKDFDQGRIKEAIRKAYLDIYDGSEEKFGDEYEYLLTMILDEVTDIKKDAITIEEIQDIVIKELMEVNPVVGKCYSDYRNKRNEERERNSAKEKFYAEILKTTNVDNDNANVDQYSFSGRKYRIADNEQKLYALRNLIDPEVRKAFEEGYIYIHDLSSYAIGDHNCLFADLPNLLNNGFRTRNGDVRPANSFSTACQLVAVIFQVQSQIQYGGVASCGIDFELEPFAHKSFVKLFNEGMYEKGCTNMREEDTNNIHIDNENLKELYPDAYDYAIRHLEKEGRQAAQGLFHNLNTLESRAGSQVPFTSLNYGRNTSTYGKLINKWLLNASIDGIGKHNRTSIFPISIFQYKKGVNDKPGTPNYELKRKAIESLSKRIYPNWGNGDWTENVDNPDDYTTFFSTMGCRTLLGRDRHTGSYSKIGRGNISPITINLVKLGIECGIALGERETPDLTKFFEELDRVLAITEKGLVQRYEYIASQNPKSAAFMYQNGTIKGYDKVGTNVREAIKHGTNAVGLIGMAECCKALFGVHHGENLAAYQFALKVIKHMSQFTKEAGDRNNMNFSLYFTPAENCCKTMRNTLYNQYGALEGVTDNKFLTNSIHVPVYHQCDVFSKLLMEAPFTKYGTGGCITYIELDSNAVHNPDALETIIDYAMAINIPYLAINFPIDTCNNCGYSSQINTDECPVCGSLNIERLKRVTGYLTTDYRNFNEGKIDEVEQRVKHTEFNPVTIPICEFAKEELQRNGIEVPKIHEIRKNSL